MTTTAGGSASWNLLHPHMEPKTDGLHSTMAHSSESESESDPEVPQGLSPVSSSSSLHTSPPRSSTAQTANPSHAAAIYCKFVGGGHEGCVDLCASVTIVDDLGNVTLDTIVKPSLPVTDYRIGSTGLSPEHVNGGMPFRKARKLVLGILRGTAGTHSQSECDSNSHRRLVLVGTNLQHVLNCLMLDHPPHLLRELDPSVAASILMAPLSREDRVKDNLLDRERETQATRAAALMLRHYIGTKS